MKITQNLDEGLDLDFIRLDVQSKKLSQHAANYLHLPFILKAIISLTHLFHLTASASVVMSLRYLKRKCGHVLVERK